MKIVIAGMLLVLAMQMAVAQGIQPPWYAWVLVIILGLWALLQVAIVAWNWHK